MAEPDLRAKPRGEIGGRGAVDICRGHVIRRPRLGDRAARTHARTHARAHARTRVRVRLGFDYTKGLRDSDANVR